jgi:hypothetical protein
VSDRGGEEPHINSLGCCSRTPKPPCLPPLPPLPKGHEAFVVGGAVRDLLLGRAAPKDFDVVASAPLKELRSLFPRAAVVGHRHPVVVVSDEARGCKLDVSSLHTNADSALIPADGCRLAQGAGQPRAGRHHHHQQHHRSSNSSNSGSSSSSSSSSSGSSSSSPDPLRLFAEDGALPPSEGLGPAAGPSWAAARRANAQGEL